MSSQETHEARRSRSAAAILENSTSTSPRSAGSCWDRGGVKAKSYARLTPIIDKASSPFACGGVAQISRIPEVTLTQSGDKIVVRAPETNLSPKWGGTLQVGEEQVKALRDLFTQLLRTSSPYILELKANAFSINIPADVLDSILSEVCDKLRINAQLSAELYTLDVYLQNGKLSKHREAQLVDDMFGTLVVCLPAYFTGGALLVVRGVETRTFFQSSGRSCEKPLPSSNSLEWCAFLTGADVEVRKVRKGVRVTANYILRRQGQDEARGPSSSRLPQTLNAHNLEQFSLTRFDLISHPLFAKMSVSDRSSDELLKEVRLHEKMRRAFDVGDMPALRKTIAEARWSVSPGCTHEVAKELARTTRYMVACEQAWHSGDKSAMLLAVKQVRTSRIGPGLWNDPLYPIMAQIRKKLASQEHALPNHEAES